MSQYFHNERIIKIYLLKNKCLYEKTVEFSYTISFYNKICRSESTCKANKTPYTLINDIFVWFEYFSRILI
ncbi:hypothetical protein CLU82_4111 [Flavobacterium sp. 5]|nr:hypothetical protein CLU82_4111 [Flavobacterium sp. 5]